MQLYPIHTSLRLARHLHSWIISVPPNCILLCICLWRVNTKYKCLSPMMLQIFHLKASQELLVISIFCLDSLKKYHVMYYVYDLHEIIKDKFHTFSMSCNYFKRNENSFDISSCQNKLLQCCKCRAVAQGSEKRKVVYAMIMALELIYSSAWKLTIPLTFCL